MTGLAAPRPPAGKRVLPTMNEDGSRRWIRPKPSPGAWSRRRTLVAWVLMAILFAAPFVRVAGKPVFLMDFPRRQFTLMGTTFLPTDTLAFMFFLGTVIIGIFLLTALFGRVWCGWACPQTVFLEFLYRPIERVFDGGYAGSRHLDKQGAWFTPRRVAKYAVYFVLSLFVAHVLLALFVGTENLYHWVLNPPSEHPTAFAFVVLTTGLVWFNFTYFREQTCLIVCPYGRWQSALLDNQSLIVAYDHRRGEPRAHAKDRPAGAGDCIACSACVQTCPTGIDIRDGLQMECVHCTQCIDACDEVMAKVGKPPGLIRYSSLDEIAGKARRLLRARTVFYPVVLSAMVGGLVLTLAARAPADVTILRAVGAPFVLQADGRVANQVRVKIGNRTDVAQVYGIEVEGIDADEDDRERQLRVIAPENPLAVGAGEARTTSIFIVLGRDEFDHGERWVQLTVADGHGWQRAERYRLLGPDGGDR